MKKLLTILFLLIIKICFGQNLVHNPSFEDTVSCPMGPDEMNKCAHWSSYSPSPDYYHADCPMSVPYNWGGYQPAASGNAYCGVATYASTSPNYRELVGSMLSSPLSVGTKYFVSFKVALSINWAVAGNCASNKMGAMFSTVPYDVFNPAPITNNPPVYTDSIITDTINWTMVWGSFIADSSYNYVILGNFFDDNHTDTLRIATGFFDAAYYYLDNVIVSTDSAFAVGIKEVIAFDSLNIYPNPFNDKLTFTNNNNQLSEIILYDIASRKVLQQTFTNLVTISTGQLVKGIYIYKVRNKNGTIKQGKVIK